MKTLDDYIILFDAECPVCSAASRALVNKGLINTEGNLAYQQFEHEVCYLVDRQRAANEIALINKTTGEVRYGVESVFKLLGTALPILNPLLLFKPFVWLMSKVYGFFSYNRRVILPIKETSAYTLQPTFKLKYRLAYLLFAWLVTAYILTVYVHLMAGPLPVGNPYREYLICGGQMVFQGLIISFIYKEKLWAYLGTLMTISLGGALLLLPGLVVAKWIALNPYVYIAYFLAVAGLMLLEHIRRTKLLGIGWTLTITWALYRILILVFIFLAN